MPDGVNVCVMGAEASVWLPALFNMPFVGAAEHARSIENLCALVRSQRFDAVVLSCEADRAGRALEALSSLRLLTPPRVLACAETGCCDGRLPGAARDEGTFKEALRAAYSTLYGVLGRPDAAVRRAAAEALLRDMGVASSLSGFSLLAEGAAALSFFSRNDVSMKGWLYPSLAREQGCSAAAVERNIRTAIERTWLAGSLTAIQRLFGYTVDAERGKPTNAECLYRLAACVQSARRVNT